MAGGGGSEGASLEEKVLEVASLILTQVKSEFNIKEAEKKYQVDYS